MNTNYEDLDWRVPCGHGCIVGRPRGAATNGACKHARGISKRPIEDLLAILSDTLRHRAELAEQLRRFQLGQEIESDYIDPFVVLPG